MEGVGNLREVADESSVEVHEPYERLDIPDLCWLRPVCDSLDFNRVHRYVVLRDNKPKVIHLLTFELALLRSKEELIGTEGLEYLSGDSPMVCERGGVDEYVVHIADGLIAVNKGAEDVVHHGLEGGG